MGTRDLTIQHCIDTLKSRELAHIFNMADFNSYYRKHGGNANSFVLGPDIADYIIVRENQRLAA